MSGNDREIQWINTLKGACILLVILHHLMLTSFIPSLGIIGEESALGQWWLALNAHLTPLRMPSFFFISGLLAASAVLRKTWREVFTKRVVNLLYVYVLWCLIQWALVSFINHYLSFDQWGVKNMVGTSYADSLNQFVVYSLTAMANTWYLYALAIYFVVCKLFKNNMLSLLLLGVAANYVAARGLLPGWGPNSVAQNALYFCVGCFYGRQVVEFLQHRRHVLGVLLVALPLALLHAHFGMNKSIFHCAIAIVLCVVICREVNARMTPNSLNWLGKNTLQVYVIHKIVTEVIAVCVVGALVHYHAFESWSFSAVWLLAFPFVGVALSVCLSLGIWRLINRGVGRALFQYPGMIKPVPALAKLP